MERMLAKTIWQRKHGLGGTKPPELRAMEHAAVALEQVAVTFGQAQRRATFTAHGHADGDAAAVEEV